MMEAAQLSVHVLKCPFGVREVEFTSAVRGAPCKAARYFGSHYAHVLSEEETTSAAPRTYAVAGTRGIQQLVATTRYAHATKNDTFVGNSNGENEAHALPVLSCGRHADVFSVHDKGRLLLWDSQSGTLVASHAFNSAFTVNHCVMTSTCMYITLEGSPATAGAEEETCVYVWDRCTLQSVTVLRGHEGRLTALALAPSNTESTTTASDVLATASLDGTVRLWRHCYNAPQSVASDTRKSASNVNHVQALAVLSATELGIIHGLNFITSEVLVVACSKCALAFGRLSGMAGKDGWGNGTQNQGSQHAVQGLKWQQARSPVDPDGSTTALHVCPQIAAEHRKTTDSNNSNAAATAVTDARSLSPFSDQRRKVHIVTGSTSGYLREWVVDVSDGDGQLLVSPTAKEEDSVAGVSVRGRWHHKAHSATVECIVTDEDVVVSTSIFDGARLYHRRSGVNCVITAAVIVPVLAPQTKQLVWGSVDGSISVASYALFASGTEREVQPLWTAKPHAAAIRGVCLSLTAELQWKALCVGAADGSMSVWRPAAPGMPSGNVVKQTQTVAPVLNFVLDTYVAAPLKATQHDAAAVITIVVGLKKEPKGHTLAVAEMHADNDALNNVQALSLPTSQNAGDITCARLCCSAATLHKLILFVGTSKGNLMQYVRGTALHGQWRSLGLSKWTATVEARHASIISISPLHLVPSRGAVIAVASRGAAPAVVSQSNASTSTTQRALLSVLHTYREKSDLIVDEVPHWETLVDMPATPLHTPITVMQNNIEKQQYVTLSWMTKADATSATVAAASADDELIMRDNRGFLLRCRWQESARRAAEDDDADQSWSGNEALLKSSKAFNNIFSGITPTLDGMHDEVVMTEGGDADILCVHVASSRKRVLMSSSVRHSSVGSLICDTGNAVVRFAAVRASSSGSSTPVDVSLYDDQGREQHRVNHDGAVLMRALAAGTQVKNLLNYTPVFSKVSSPSSASQMAPPVACTLLVASSVDRLLFIGYNDGLLQMVDTTTVFVFMRVWVKDSTGAPAAIREVRYADGVVLVRLADGCLRVFVIPPRSILDQSMPVERQKESLI
ncbi:hypothetical protein ABL78_6246 [Leptomonas seymouri]|uniref:Uncharacterized protein n=1 Tax=Leptomonas seymouri TaxID=5684 RepID=A0A0N1IJ23_LEPSE|nr:hypothetical protein ABL78_6246 [Leptomonas seymouri]|eukprot:KPI84700.1 hypothetical protein ABL78_6246 [Leptomonas seymouri]